MFFPFAFYVLSWFPFLGFSGNLGIIWVLSSAISSLLLRHFLNVYRRFVLCNRELPFTVFVIFKRPRIVWISIICLHAVQYFPICKVFISRVPSLYTFHHARLYFRMLFVCACALCPPFLHLLSVLSFPFPLTRFCAKLILVGVSTRVNIRPYAGIVLCMLSCVIPILFPLFVGICMLYTSVGLDVWSVFKVSIYAKKMSLSTNCLRIVCFCW